jgi:hypothetical protein
MTRQNNETCGCGARKVPGTAWCFTCNPKYPRPGQYDETPRWWSPGCRPADYGYRPEYNPSTHNPDGSEKS